MGRLTTGAPWISELGIWNSYASSAWNKSAMRNLEEEVVPQFITARAVDIAFQVTLSPRQARLLSNHHCPTQPRASPERQNQKPEDLLPQSRTQGFPDDAEGLHARASLARVNQARCCGWLLVQLSCWRVVISSCAISTVSSNYKAFSSLAVDYNTNGTRECNCTLVSCVAF